MNKLNEKKMLVLLLVFSLIVLAITPFFRQTSTSYNRMLIGEESYYHTRISETMVKQGLLKEDIFVYGNNPYLFNPYHMVLAGLALLLGMKIMLVILPLSLGILTVLIFYLILTELKVKHLIRVIAVFILICSPVFIYNFTTLSQAAFVLFISLLAFFLFMKKNNICYGLSLVLFFIIPFFGFIYTLIALAVLLAISVKRKIARRFIMISFIMLLTAAVLHTFIFSVFNFHTETFTQVNIFSKLIFVFGALAGLSLFAVLLSIVGFLSNWKNKLFNFSAMVFLLILLILAVYVRQSLLLHLNIVVSAFAAIGFYSIIKRKWEFGLLRKLTILVLFCGLLFSTFSYFGTAVSQQPTKELFNSLLWLKLNSEAKGVVFSHYKNGFFIQKFANRTVLLESNLATIELAEEKLADSDRIFYSRNLINTKNLLKKYKIRYIFITPEMKKGIVWSEEEEGLLFLFRNTETFKNVYSVAEYEIWEYLKWKDK